ncbi:MAG: Crp/Fnr family transcriptional regulator [Paracoccaceae bacterium]|nr:Crp/Fnr family transcriptional regulator [Paracoccaceae bacterium]
MAEAGGPGQSAPPHEKRQRGRLDALVDALPADLQRELHAMGERKSIPSGDILVEDGAFVDHIGFLSTGVLAMTKVLADDRRHIVGMLVPNDMYGRLFDGPSPVRIEALSDAEVVSFPRARFETLLRRSPAAERLFLVSLLDELDAAREWVLVLGGPKVVQRVAAFLLIICRREIRGMTAAVRRANGPVNVRIFIKRSDLAHYLGARPESLSRAFHELEDAGVIRINDPYDFDVLDMAGLVDISGHDLVLDEDPPGRPHRR